MSQRTIEDVIGRMYNWKMSSAYAFALETPDFPADALAILKDMCDEYGNCGWNEGKAFDLLRQSNHKVADILGYRWDDEGDQWVKKNSNDAATDIR